MDRFDLAAALKRKGLTHKQIANDLKCSPELISATVTRRFDSKRVQIFIAGLLEMPIGEVFPGSPHASS